MGVLLLVVATGFGVGCVFAGPSYQGPSPHFRDGKFHNLVPRPPRDFTDWKHNPGPWSDEQRGTPGPRPPTRVEHGLRVTWVGHSTLLVQVDGLNILTDPIWSERASPVGFAGPLRRQPPGIRFEELPPIDLVLVSHNHYDHMDLDTLERLHTVFRPHVVVSLGNAELLGDEGLDDVTELDWWQGVEVAPGVTVTAVPEQHFSGRGLTDRNETLWVGYVISTPSGRIYFAGDTGYGPQFTQARERFGPMRLALLPIGAYVPHDFMGPVHISPEEAVRAATDLEAQTSVAMHFGTFRLADDAQDQPPRDLAAALAAQTVIPPERFVVPGLGVGIEVP